MLHRNAHIVILFIPSPRLLSPPPPLPSPVPSPFTTEDIDRSKATVLTFLPGQSEMQTFTVPLQWGEQLVFLPFSLQTSNKTCKQVLIVDGMLQVTGGGGMWVNSVVMRKSCDVVHRSHASRVM